MKLVVLVALFAVVAQIVPSCGGGTAPEVVGWVEEKYERSPRVYVVINHVHYAVPHAFWAQVGIGDLVKYDGTQWTIVKRASEYQ